MKQATVNLYRDNRKGVDSLKLCITFERKRKYYSTSSEIKQRLHTKDFKVDEDTFGKLKANAFKNKPDGEYKKTNPNFLQLWHLLFSRDDKMLGYAVFAQSITEQLGPNFTFDRFKELLDSHGKEPDAPAADVTDLLNALSLKEADMVAQGRIGNGASYGLAGKSLGRFIESLSDEEKREFKLPVASKRSKKVAPAPALHFQHLTPALLKLYEQWMTTDQGLTLTTVGIYLRHVRAVFNDAINAGIVSRDAYPFGKKRYVVPAGRNLKKALSKQDVLKIIGYQPEEDWEQRARDFWVFSYLSNGMNFTDILSLRWGDIDHKASKLSFLRQKTTNTTKGKQQRVRVELLPESREIMERWANPDRKATAFVFPFLSDDMDARRRKMVTSQFIKITNKYVRIIGKKLGIEGDVTTYAARHSFATILLRSEAPLAFISQSLGHTNISTTEAYLGSFDDEQTKKYLQALT